MSIVKRIGKLIVYCVIFMALVLFFLPKTNLYYKGEEVLQRYNVVLAQEFPDDRGLLFSVRDAKLYYEELFVADIAAINVMPWLLFNRITVEAFNLSPDMERFGIKNVDKLVVTQHVLNPLHITAVSEGNFGTCTVDIDLKNKKATLMLNALPELEAAKPFWLQKLKKTEGGAYQYETTY